MQKVLPNIQQKTNEKSERLANPNVTPWRNVVQARKKRKKEKELQNITSLQWQNQTPGNFQEHKVYLSFHAINLHKVSKF